ncbi:MAG: sulfate/molybdate ABC transporter ATP-binding protein [Dehalococcoidia bacterium]|jgi:molybdate transport system ATP-binding protein
MLEVRIKRKLPGFSLDVNFSVDHQPLSIMGPSGSGKTMTLQCIAGLLLPDEGYIRLNDKVLFDSANRISSPPQMRRVGFVFQNYALFPHFTVGQNIAYGLRQDHKGAAKQAISRLLDKLNIMGLEQRYPRQLSAGQQQRVAVARAIASDPDILLLDEPFSALDTTVRERLQFELKALPNFYKGTILFVTHDLAEAYSIGSKIAVYEAGHIAQFDDKERVIASPASRSVAKLTGVKNLFDGFVTDIKGQDVWIKVPALGIIFKAVPRNGSNLPINRRVTIGIRPEYIRLIDHPGENTLLSTLERVIEEVATIRYCFFVSETGAPIPLIMAVSRDLKEPLLQEGKNYTLYLPPESIIIVTD